MNTPYTAIRVASICVPSTAPHRIRAGRALTSVFASASQAPTASIKSASLETSCSFCPFEQTRYGVFRLLLDVPQVIFIAETLGIDLVDILRA